MIAALLIAASVLVAVVALVVHLAPFPRWPEQAERSWCARCAASFRGDRGLALHVVAMHPETYEHSGLAQLAEHRALNAVGGCSNQPPRTMPATGRRERVEP